LSFEARFYFSAFVSAARSVTWAIQASLSHVNGFETWYSTVQQRLQDDALSRFFVQTRNMVQKRGHNPFGQVGLSHLAAHLERQMRCDHRPVLMIPDPSAPNEVVLSDAIAACTKYFTDLVTVVWDCYEKYRTVVDERWYFTQEHFEQMHKSIEDALEELGFPRTWLAALPGHGDADAWRVIRSQAAGCGINHVFQRYIGREIRGPDDDESGP